MTGNSQADTVAGLFLLSFGLPELFSCSEEPHPLCVHLTGGGVAAGRCQKARLLSLRGWASRSGGSGWGD